MVTSRCDSTQLNAPEPTSALPPIAVPPAPIRNLRRVIVIYGRAVSPAPVPDRLPMGVSVYTARRISKRPRGRETAVYRVGGPFMTYYAPRSRLSCCERCGENATHRRERLPVPPLHGDGGSRAHRPQSITGSRYRAAVRPQRISRRNYRAVRSTCNRPGRTGNGYPREQTVISYPGIDRV